VWIGESKVKNEAKAAGLKTGATLSKNQDKTVHAILDVGIAWSKEPSQRRGEPRLVDSRAAEQAAQVIHFFVEEIELSR
jgi:hypothetical protein